jgi:REP element-mobilizing transposase RayT
VKHNPVWIEKIEGNTMPILARIIVPRMPHHIVQRGHNRNVVFVEDRDYKYYLNNLVEWKAALDLEIYSYCLMTNHVHLIAGATDRVGGARSDKAFGQAPDAVH